MRSAILAATGTALILISIVFLPTPLPFGLPLILLGAFLLAQMSPRVRRWIGRLRACFPRFESALARRRPSLPRSLRYFLGLTRPSRGAGIARPAMSGDIVAPQSRSVAKNPSGEGQIPVDGN